MTPFNEVLGFWFEELTPKQWFVKDSDLDQMIHQRFGMLLKAAALGECFEWRNDARGRLAEIIVLDQFSRNIHRAKPDAFSQDPMALALAQEAVLHGIDQQLTVDQRRFLYMPYMHSESAVIHEQALLLFNQPGLESNYAYEVQHKQIIDRFGRYPHRNEILGRESTPEEIEFLKQPGSSF